MVGAGDRCSAEADAGGAGSICAQFRRSSPGSPLPTLHRSASADASGHSAARTGGSAACCYRTPLSADDYARSKRDPAFCSSSAAPRANSYPRPRGDSAACYGNTSSSADGYATARYGHATFSADGHAAPCYTSAASDADSYTTACYTNLILSIDGYSAICCANNTPSADGHARIGAALPAAP